MKLRIPLRYKLQAKISRFILGCIPNELLPDQDISTYTVWQREGDGEPWHTGEINMSSRDHRVHTTLPQILESLERIEKKLDQ